MGGRGRSGETDMCALLFRAPSPSQAVIRKPIICKKTEMRTDTRLHGNLTHDNDDHTEDLPNLGIEPVPLVSCI